MRKSGVFQKIYRWFFPGENASLFCHGVARSLFLRGLGVIYLIAILSWWTQIHLLVGENGLIPAGKFLEQISHLSYWKYPAIFRLIGTGDIALHLICALGCVFSISLILGWLPGPSLLALWGIYLSLLNTGGPFMSFQWDILLVETGLLAILFAPWSTLKIQWRNPPPLQFSHRIVLVFLWILMAKLMFFSGWVKLAWASPQTPEWWPDHTAMTFHYFTQPLPTWTAWWMHQLPAGFQKFSLWPMYFVELVLPFVVFLGPRLRLVAAIGFAGLMGLILLTGNYTYFNWLTIVLCIPLIANRFWPKWFLRLLKIETTGSDRRSNPVVSWAGIGIRGLVLIPILILNFQSVLSDLHQAPNPVLKKKLSPQLLDDFAGAVTFWHPVSGYGLFRTMTTTRPEIILEGSYDGQLWKEYDFRWKVDKLDARPRFVAPHQPRVAWQMWFAALNPPYHPQKRDAPWLGNLVMKLLKGKRDVQAFFNENPFPDVPPRFVRARLYEYEFTTRIEKRESGNWWRRRLIGEYLQPVSLRQ